MAYATWNDIVAVDKTYSDRMGAELMNSGTIFFAEREIDSRLAPMFSVPFSGSPPTIRDLTVLETLRRLNIGNKEEEYFRALVDEQVKRLLSGEALIVTGSGTTISPASTSGASVWAVDQDYKQTFDMRDPMEQAIDDDLIDALDDEADDA